jgi:hypothetical protein
MTQSSRKSRMRILGYDYGSKRARHHGLRAVARALGLRDFLELRRSRRRKLPYKYTAWVHTSSSLPFATIRNAPSGRVR